MESAKFRLQRLKVKHRTLRSYNTNLRDLTRDLDTYFTKLYDAARQGGKRPLNAALQIPRRLEKLAKEVENSCKKLEAIIHLSAVSVKCFYVKREQVYFGPDDDEDGGEIRNSNHGNELCETVNEVYISQDTVQIEILYDLVEAWRNIITTVNSNYLDLSDRRKISSSLQIARLVLRGLLNLPSTI